MRTLRRHKLVRSDVQSAADWYEEQRAGLGKEFLDEFRVFHARLPNEATRHAIRFGNIRRLNLKRFPYAIFYAVSDAEIWVLAVLHARRDHDRILEGRRETPLAS